MNWLRKFMQGRYGVDALSMNIIILGFLLSIFSSFNESFSILSTIVFIYAYYRIFSRDINKRYMENQKFLKCVEPITTKFKKIKMKFRKNKMKAKRSKDYKYFKCKNCGKEIKVPKGKGKIKVTCPKCGEKTIKKT